jgi:prepilin-type N-terminal cleavage/methylation domain-containing protein
MRKETNTAGFTLIELMIVVAIIAIIASIAIPKLLSARLAANEAAALATLRTVSTAQAQLQSSGAIDSDGDGSGEYGYFAELSGAVPLRVTNNGTPAAGGVGDLLNPAILPQGFGTVQNGLITRSGYHFRMWLPDAAWAGAPEALAGGADAANFPHSDHNEIGWCCYAWPVEVGSTGTRAFFISSEGDLLSCNNRQANRYTGDPTSGGYEPSYDEAYDTAGVMNSGLRTGSVGGNDGTLWALVD